MSGKLARSAKPTAILALLCALSFSTIAQEQPAPEYQLIELLGGKDQIVQIHNEFVALMAKANPELAPFESTLQAWAETYLTWEEIREGMAEIYRKYFTAEELEQMAAFYSSPTGRKSVVLLPTLFREGNQLSATLAKKHQQELINMVRAEMAQQVLEEGVAEGTEPTPEP